MSLNGPLTISANGRYFVDQSGIPVFIRGIAAWNFGTTGTPTDFSTFCSDITALGYNAIQLIFADNQYNTGNTRNSSTWGPNYNGNLPFLRDTGGSTYSNAQTQNALISGSNINTSYFMDFDPFMDTAASSNLWNFFYISWDGNPQAGQPGTEGYDSAFAATASSANLKSYASTVVGRYGASGTRSHSNLIYALIGDNIPSNASFMTDLATGVRQSDTTTLMYVDGLDGDSDISRWGATTVTSGSTFNLLQCDGVYSDPVVGGHPFMAAQCKTEWQNSAGNLSVYVLFEKETIYEGAGSTRQNVRAETAWHSVLGGCIGGFFFGNNPLWQAPTNWATLISTTGSSDAQVAGAFFQSRAFWLLVPDYAAAFVTSGAGSVTSGTSVGGATISAYVSSARASDGSWGVIYAPNLGGTGSITVDLSGFSALVQAHWVDPTTGTLTPVTSSPFNVSGTAKNTGSATITTTPGTNAGGGTDWAIVMNVLETDIIAFATNS